jgi:hypothetical protein
VFSCQFPCQDNDGKSGILYHSCNTRNQLVEICREDLTSYKEHESARSRIMVEIKKSNLRSFPISSFGCDAGQ